MSDGGMAGTQKSMLANRVVCKGGAHAGARKLQWQGWRCRHELYGQVLFRVW